LEVLTPFSSVSHNYISVFITLRNGGYVVSDGGWLSSGAYHGNFEVTEDVIIKSGLEYSMMAFSVDVFAQGQGNSYYFKKCEDKKMLSACVYDVANFVSSMVNSISMSFGDAQDEQRNKLFQTRANEFMGLHYSKDRIRYRHRLDDVQGASFSAAVFSGIHMSLITYVTGSTEHYFAGDLRKSIVNFELANKSRKYAQLITHRLALIDDDADGYIPSKIRSVMDLLGEKTSVPPVLWRDRQQVIELVA
jgi:hypothetical protein